PDTPPDYNRGDRFRHRSRPMSREQLNQRLSQISTAWSALRQAHEGTAAEATAAQRLLLERYSGAAHRYLLRATGDPHAADELAPGAAGAGLGRAGPGPADLPRRAALPGGTPRREFDRDGRTARPPARQAAHGRRRPPDLAPRPRPVCRPAPRRGRPLAGVAGP